MAVLRGAWGLGGHGPKPRVLGSPEKAPHLKENLKRLLFQARERNKKKTN